MPAGTKVAKAESILARAAAKKGLTGAEADRYVYGALNHQGLKRGNKTTKRGAAKAIIAR